MHRKTLFYTCLSFLYLLNTPVQAVEPQLLANDECTQQFVDCECTEFGCLPQYNAKIEIPSKSRIIQLKKGAWKEGCPLALEDIRIISLLHFDENGTVKKGELVVSHTAAEDLGRVFGKLYEERFPIHKMVSVEHYGGSDDLSMKDNNTSALNCRVVKGSKTWSEHSKGLAIDINPLWNPYVRGRRVEPDTARPFADRTLGQEGMIHHSSSVVQLFKGIGWRWGGYWRKSKDYQHFSKSGR